MKKKFLYVALFALTLASCSDQEIIEHPSVAQAGSEGQHIARRPSGGQAFHKNLPTRFWKFWVDTTLSASSP